LWVAKTTPYLHIASPLGGGHGVGVALLSSGNGGGAFIGGCGVTGGGPQTGVVMLLSISNRNEDDQGRQW
jgi:hypothetical protein